MAKTNEAIISIRPNFAEAILAGVKTVELRRRIPLVEVGTRLWIYATRPKGAIVGSAIVGGIIKSTPETVWNYCSEQAGISLEDFDRYFDGAKEAIAISLTFVHRVKPIEISQLRIMREGFHPPQVIAKLSSAEAHSLHAWST